MQFRLLLVLTALCLVLPGCAPKINMFGSQATEPLKEFVVEGDGDGKLALIHLRGFLTAEPSQGFLRSRPSQVQELVNALKLAEKDDAVQGVVIAIDSPGGTTTASDILYHEITGFKDRSGKKVVAAMFDVAASGGYYAALPADWILAHPTTITGSVGVVFMRPKLNGLMDKVGVDVEISKSGVDKDMGSPFRPTTPEEEALFQAIIDDFAARFHSLVAKHRNLSPADMDTVKTARVFTANQAKAIGLIDQVGYVQDAFAKARSLSGLPTDCKVITYRRDIYPNDNPYNTMDSANPAKLNMLGVDASYLLPPRAGFYYVWPNSVTQ
ncbi:MULTISPECIES: signal peptide peptidase SppA [unclassified Pseudodesulfovibrio]|uniref:signal peptide peptidase SppA n=1 Tax=unclassified Pseudodesulfovibrio TaxID=2661612 RepID=UPI000FEB9BA9|nr:MULTISPECIES: signal peptide peptidase SppA [unclassified Pseudodesulfovibrio]MCJ2165378.1 signal peptide peptidase SppA [Pseudodesulfovibrio sp. S3-i]RWU02840.1 signal peptide peptidase SppA [Pseudodesulfovibrio sp. S3]